MKRSIILFLFFISVVINFSCKTGKNTVGINTVKNSEESKNYKENTQWWGSYFATIPCSDCDETEIQLSLTKNSNFVLIVTDKGKQGSFNSFGTISWNNTGNAFVLEGVISKNKYKNWMFQDEKLILLDTNENFKTNINDYSFKKTLKEEYNSYILNKYWRLIEINGGEPIYSEGNSEVNISFSSDAKIFGSLGCNNFNAIFTFDKGNKISISNILQTKKMCLDMTIEEEMKMFFEQIKAYDIVDGKLIFKNGENKILAKFEEIYKNQVFFLD